MSDTFLSINYIRCTPPRLQQKVDKIWKLVSEVDSYSEMEAVYVSTSHNLYRLEGYCREKNIQQLQVWQMMHFAKNVFFSYQNQFNVCLSVTKFRENVWSMNPFAYSGWHNFALGSRGLAYMHRSVIFLFFSQNMVMCGIK